VPGKKQKTKLALLLGLAKSRYYLNIDIRIIGKNNVVHRCIGVSLQPYSPHKTKEGR